MRRKERWGKAGARRHTEGNGKQLGQLTVKSEVKLIPFRQWGKVHFEGGKEGVNEGYSDDCSKAG